MPSAKSAKAIVSILFGSAGINGFVNIIGTTTVVGKVTDYAWKGVPTISTGRTKYLNGLKVEYKDKNGRNKVYKENYQGDAFNTKNLTFGRMMFYNVYGIDDHPTTWR